MSSINSLKSVKRSFLALNLGFRLILQMLNGGEDILIWLVAQITPQLLLETGETRPVATGSLHFWGQYAEEDLGTGEELAFELPGFSGLDFIFESLGLARMGFGGVTTNGRTLGIAFATNLALSWQCLDLFSGVLGPLVVSGVLCKGVVISALLLQSLVVGTLA